MTIEQVLKNIMEIKCNEMYLRDEIITAFEDYDFEGVTEIVVEHGDNNRFWAYANHPQAKEILCKYEIVNDKVSIVYAEII